MVPVENSRGPSLAPLLMSSAFVKTVSVLFDGSCDVVMPKATLAASGQFDCASSPFDSPPTWPCTSIMPGMMVLPVTSMRRAPAGTGTADAGPTATTRLPSTSTVALSITPGVPAIEPGFRPDIVITRAPTSASDPEGLSLLIENPIGTPLASGSAFIDRGAAPDCG
jgi:hypothetical protein